MCSVPEAVGGGASIEKTSSRVFVRSKRYVPRSSQTAAHLSSSPSRLGFSGTRRSAMVKAEDTVLDRTCSAGSGFADPARRLVLLRLAAAQRRARPSNRSVLGGAADLAAELGALGREHAP